MPPTYESLVELVGPRRALMYAQVRGLYGRTKTSMVEIAARKGISKQRVFQIVERVEDYLAGKVMV